jgi:uncharacterized protein with PIN domain/DNA-directed RNA polymerase subunit RPC12/RpoP
MGPKAEDLKMAVPCPRCGREYDVTLFQFGRTIHCTCGSRVGLEKRLGPPLSGGKPRFIADAMLGRLARWLRVLGYDTAFDADIEDETLVRRSFEEGRHILTRDRRLPQEWRIRDYLVVGDDEPLEQLRQIAGHFALRWDGPLFTRCTVCNMTLEAAAREDVAEEVPPRVLEASDRFARCPGCGRVYWEGSHTERMRARLARILG